MKTLKSITILAAFALLVTGLCFGQFSTLTKTYLTNAIASTDTVWVVTSTTGMVAPTSGQNGTIIYVDRESVYVATVLSATQVQVKRTSNPVAHNAATTLYFGYANQFHATDPIGKCAVATLYASPWINTKDNRVWTCDSTNLDWNSGDKLSQVITEARAITGSQRVIRGEFITGAAVSITSGTLVGVRGAITAGALGNLGSGTYYWGVQGKAITGTATIDVGSGQFAGVFGQLDVTGGTISSGHVAALSGNVFGSNSGSFPYVNDLYLENAGGGVLNSFIQMFGKTNYVFDVQTNVHTQASKTCTPGSVTGGTGGLRILVDGTEKWIPLAATCT